MPFYDHDKLDHGAETIPFEDITSLQQGIERRQSELHHNAATIALAGGRLTRISNILKILTILLGAIAAAKGTADNLLGVSSAFNAILFSLIGIVISVSAGIEAAFKLDKRGAELVVLASNAQSIVRLIDTEWRKEIGSADDSDLRGAARKLITLADEKLAKMQEDAARLGINITLNVYELAGHKYRRMVAA